MIEQRPTQTQSVNIDDEPIIDIKAAGYFLGYLMRSMRRRRRTVVMTFAITTLITGAVCVVMPRVYKINTRILTSRSLRITNLVDPENTIPKEMDNPTLGAVELIKSRENLENLMNDINLQSVWEAKRSVLYKWKDKAQSAVFDAPSEQDKHEAFLKLLDDRIVADVDKEVVTMEVEWPDPDIAMSLAEGAVARFRKMRHDMEMSELLETVNILERNVEQSRQNIEEAVGHMQKVFNEKERDLQARGVSKGVSKGSHKSKVVAIRKPQGADVVDPAADNLKRSLAENQSELASVRRGYEARVKKAEEELANLRASLGPEHPDVVEAKRNLEQIRQLPPELAALQDQGKSLADKVQALPAAAPAHEEPTVQVQNRDTSNDEGDMLRVPVSDELYQELETDPEIASILDDLKKREDKHDSYLRRLSSARILSEAADVAFEYRYIMTVPPVYPKKPVKPNVPLMLGGGLVVGLLLGVAFAVASDVFSKRVLEAWQVERFLKLKVLGEVREP